MRARLETETAIDIMAHNVKKMSDSELVQAGYYYMDYFKITRDEESKEILKLIEAEQDKRGIY